MSEETPNQENNEKKPSQLEDMMGNMLVIGAVKSFLIQYPQVAGYFPQFLSAIEQAEKTITDFLGNHEKMVVLTSYGGAPRIIVIDTTKPFELSNLPGHSFGWDSDKGNYNLLEWKAKLMDSPAWKSIEENCLQIIADPNYNVDAKTPIIKLLELGKDTPPAT